MKRLATILIAAFLASPSAAQEDPLKLRGRQLETKASLRQNEVQMEGLADELSRRVTTVDVDVAPPGTVDREELRERMLSVYEGRAVTGSLPSTARAASAAAPSKNPSSESDDGTSPYGTWLLAGALVGILFLVLRRRQRSFR